MVGAVVVAPFTLMLAVRALRLLPIQILPQDFELPAIFFMYVFSNLSLVGVLVLIFSCIYTFLAVKHKRQLWGVMAAIPFAYMALIIISLTGVFQ